ncbi:MAG TPA: M48 family metallopeptidase, partial [Trichormus sp.]
QDNIPPANIPGAASKAPAYQAPAAAYQAPAPVHQPSAPTYPAPAPAYQAPPSQAGYAPTPPAPAWMDRCRLSDYELRTEQAVIDDDIVNVDQLIHPREKFYCIVATIISCMIYLLLVLTIIGLLIIPIVYLCSYLIGCVYHGYLRSNGIRISPQQFPEVYEAAEQLCSRMGMPVPQMFVSQEHGLLNAYAKRAHRKDIVVIYSSVFEMGYERGLEELKFVLAHELTHVKRGHVKWAWLRSPAGFVPFLAHAYSRACEYTCDRVAATLVPKGALYGLVALASGTHLYKHVNLAALNEQQDSDWDFWTWYAEILSTHPNLINRIRACGAMVLPDPEQWDDSSPAPERHGGGGRRRWSNLSASIILIGLSTALCLGQPPAHAKKEPRGNQRAQAAREARERAAEKSREESAQSADDSQQGDNSQSDQGTQQTDGDSSTSSSDQGSSSDESAAQLDAMAKQLGGSAGKAAAAGMVAAVEILIIGLILINTAGGGVLGGLLICAFVYHVGKLFRGGRKPAIG